MPEDAGENAPSTSFSKGCLRTSTLAKLKITCAGHGKPQQARHVSRSQNFEPLEAHSHTLRSTIGSRSKRRHQVGAEWSRGLSRLLQPAHRRPARRGTRAIASRSKLLGDRPAKRTRCARGRRHEMDAETCREYPDRAVIVPLLEIDLAPPRSESDWIMRRGRFVHRVTGELF